MSSKGKKKKGGSMSDLLKPENRSFTAFSPSFSSTFQSPPMPGTGYMHHPPPPVSHMGYMPPAHQSYTSSFGSPGLTLSASSGPVVGALA